MVIQSLSAIEHLLKYRPERILSLSCQSPFKSNPRVDSLLALAKDLGLRVGSHPRKEGTSEPLIAEVKAYGFADWSNWLESLKTQKHSLVLACDHLQDPQNLGALCRTAEALGVAGVLIPKDRSVGITAGAYHASVGAIETIPVLQVTNLNEALRKLKEEDFWIVGAALGDTAKPLLETPTFNKIVLVLGTELEGLKPSTLSTCDWLVHIPLKGKVDSLNVSAAGAILMHALLSRFEKT